MKRFIRKKLTDLGIYYPLKYSFIFELYIFLFKRTELAQRKSEVSFYQSFLSPCNLIFDIGAYDGHKTEAFLKIADRVVSCEPDEKSYSILRCRFRKKKQRVIPENIALDEAAGEKAYLIHHPGSAFNTLSPQWKETLEKDNMEKWNEKIRFSMQRTVQTTTLDLLIEKYGKPYFIKIDVEGYEEKVLKGLSQKVPYLSFEALLPDGNSELLACIDRIEKLSSTARYNVAVHEKLLLEKFAGKNELIGWLQQNPVMHLEIIAQMEP